MLRLVFKEDACRLHQEQRESYSMMVGLPREADACQGGACRQEKDRTDRWWPVSPGLASVPPTSSSKPRGPPGHPLSHSHPPGALLDDEASQVALRGEEASLHAEASNPMLSSGSMSSSCSGPAARTRRRGQPLCTGSPRPFPSAPGAPSASVAQGGLHLPSLGALREGEGGTGYSDSMSSFTLYTRACFSGRVRPSGRDGLDPAP